MFRLKYTITPKPGAGLQGQIVITAAADQPWRLCEVRPARLAAVREPLSLKDIPIVFDDDNASQKMHVYKLD